jgi:hypothetical protein
LLLRVSVKTESKVAGALAYQTQINQILRSHMEGNGLMLKRRLKMIDLSKLWKNV